MGSAHVGISENERADNNAEASLLKPKIDLSVKLNYNEAFSFTLQQLVKLWQVEQDCKHRLWHA